MCQIHTILKNPDDFPSLSEYLAYLRKVRKFTLQGVVDLVAKSITRKVLPAHCSLTKGYLSLLEAGKFDEPSPHKLRALAYVYNIPCDLLLLKAGYLDKAPDKRPHDVRFRTMLKEVQGLTSDEQQSLIEYIEFMKSKRTKSCKKCQ